jgi:hypothetical protein
LIASLASLKSSMEMPAFAPAFLLGGRSQRRREAQKKGRMQASAQ